VTRLRRHQEIAVIRVPVPDECDTLEQHEQAHHRDLDRMTRAELQAERRRVIVFLLFARRPADWHRERLDRIDETLKEPAWRRRTRPRS
jgi:hypothetical protein